MLSTENAFHAQEPEVVTAEPELAVVYDISMDNSKAEILEFAKSHSIEVESTDNKGDLLWGIAKVLGVAPETFGVEETE